MISYGKTDIGMCRNMNQDCIFFSDKSIGNLPNLYIVADGMGGHNAGDFASRYTVNTVREYIAGSREKNPIKLINEAIQLANRGIIKEASEHAEMYGMGTTVVVTTIIDEYAYTANVGDSRLYLYDGGLKQITRDHSLVMEMVRLGEISKEEAKTHPDRHIITRAVGASDELNVDFFDYQMPPDSMILMCSDGLCTMVEDEEIRMIIEAQPDLAAKAQKLVDTANARGGRDNIAVVVIDPFG